MQYSAQHNLCIYKEPVLGEHRQLVKGFTVRERFIVPCTISNMQTLAAFGYETVSPIFYNYNWPSNKQLVPQPFEHQRHTSAFITLHPRCFVLSDMRTGKTLSVLWAYDYLMKIGEIKKCLILCKKSCFYDPWESSIFTHFLSNRRCSILYGDREKRCLRLSDDADFYILNHDGLGVGTGRDKHGLALGGLAETIRRREDINAVIVDEGSAYKEAGTNRYKVLRKVLAEKKYVTWMTGTPVPNAPTDAYAQAKIVRQEYHEAFTAFKSRTMKQITSFKWIPQEDGYQKAAEIMQPAIRYSRDECFELPPVVSEIRQCKLSSEQMKAYEALRKECQVKLVGGTVTAVHEGALRQKLIQVACGAVYDENHQAHLLDCTDRISVLREVIEEAGHKILIFSPLTSVVDMLYSELKHDYSVEKINGEVSVKNRNEIFTAFQQNESPRIIIADARTVAHGVDFTRASVTVWYAPIDQGEIYDQANARMRGPKQKNKMLIVKIAATEREREMYKRLDSKVSMQGLMLDLIKEGV